MSLVRGEVVMATSRVQHMLVFSVLGCACVADASKTGFPGAAGQTLESFANHRAKAPFLVDS